MITQHLSICLLYTSDAADVAAVTDPLHVAAVTGTCSAVGMAGLTMGGGYGPLIGRFGLALDNLLAAEVVLADGRTVVASRNSEEELFWALRGGGGNFGVVTAMRYRLHDLGSVRTGLLVYPFAEARGVLRSCADIAASSPEDLTVEFACTGGPDGKPVIIVHPTWCGPAAEGEAPVAPFLKLGTLLAGNLDAMSYGTSLTLYDPYIVNGQRVFMDTCWLPALDSAAIDVFVEAMDTAASTQCALFTHEFKGAASRVPVEATAFGLRRDHCWSRSSPPSSIGRTRKRSNGIANGLEPLVKPSIRSRFRVDIRTFFSRTMRTVWRRAMAPMPAG